MKPKPKPAVDTFVVPSIDGEVIHCNLPHETICVEHRSMTLKFKPPDGMRGTLYAYPGGPDPHAWVHYEDGTKKRYELKPSEDEDGFEIVTDPL